MVTTILTQLSIPKVNAAAMGDIVKMADGTYDHPSEEIITKAGVTFTAANPGKAVIKGQPIDVGGAGTVMRDFDLQYSDNARDYVNLRGEGCQFIGNKLHFANTLSTTQDWITIKAKGCIVSGNEAYGKNGLGNVILINDVFPDCKIQNNYVHHITGGSGNGAEIFRIGWSGIANKILNCDISGNTIEDTVTSDDELFSIKSSGNNIHDNDIINCAASITLRHGHGNKVVNNRFTNSGLRVHGKDNVITDNTFFKNARKQLLQFVISNGDVAEDVEGSNANYSQVRNNQILRNKIINEDASDLILFCFGESSRSLKPIGNFIRDNKFSASSGTLASTKDGASWNGNTISGNEMWATGTALYGNMPTSGYVKKDPFAPPPPVLTIEERIKRLEDKVFGPTA